MPRNSSNPRPHPARVEDYDSDEGQVRPETAQSANKTANVTARKESQVPPATKVRVNTGPDTASDSGYSSRTAATMNSADSAKELRGDTPRKETKKDKKVVVQDKPVPPIVDAPRTGREPIVKQQRSPTKPSARSTSQNRRSQHVQSYDPNYPAARQSSKQTGPLESGMDINYPPFNEQPARSSQNYGSYHTSQQATAGLGQPRPRATSASRSRRQSYYEGAPLEAYYDPSYHQEPRGPPPSQSAYANQRLYPYMGHTGSNAGFYPPTATTIQPASIHPRSEQPSARRPDSKIYERPPPLVTYGPSAPVTGPSARRQDPYPPQAYDSELNFYDTDEDDPDRMLMPPPSSFPSRQSSLRHSPYVTPPVTDYAPENYFEDARPSAIHRSSSTRRPPSHSRSGSSGPSRSSAYTNTSNLARVTTVESSAPSSRRYSYVGGGGYDATSAADLEYARRQRRYKLDDDQAAAESYQERRRAEAPPADYMYDTVRSTETLRPGIQRVPSKAGSERSRKTAGSGSSRTSVQPDGSVKLRVDARKGIEFSGDMEGRTIGVIPGRGGMAEVTISAAAGGRETVYGGSKSSGGSGTRGLRSERGRKVGRVADA